MFRHPAIQGCDCVLAKLPRFHVKHQTAPETMLADLRAAGGQVPLGERAAEAAPLGEVLPLVLAELGGGPVQSSGSGAAGPA